MQVRRGGPDAIQRRRHVAGPRHKPRRAPVEGAVEPLHHRQALARGGLPQQRIRAHLLQRDDQVGIGLLVAVGAVALGAEALEDVAALGGQLPVDGVRVRREAGAWSGRPARHRSAVDALGLLHAVGAQHRGGHHQPRVISPADARVEQARASCAAATRRARPRGPARAGAAAGAASRPGERLRIPVRREHRREVVRGVDADGVRPRVGAHGAHPPGPAPPLGQLRRRCAPAGPRPSRRWRSPR